jgi:hypothetical protein
MRILDFDIDGTVSRADDEARFYREQEGRGRGAAHGARETDPRAPAEWGRQSRSPARYVRAFRCRR